MLVFIASCINFDLSKGIFSFPKNKTMESMVSARSLFRNYGFLFMQQILVGYGSCLLNFHYSLKKVKLLIMKRAGFFFHVEGYTKIRCRFFKNRNLPFFLIIIILGVEK